MVRDRHDAEQLADHKLPYAQVGWMGGLQASGARAAACVVV